VFLIDVSPVRLPDSQASPMSIFANNSESLWLNLSQLSLALYTTVQILFFFLSFYRLVEAFLDQQRIEMTLADEHHHFNGIGWITVGIKLGVIESIVGFALGGLAVPLSRRILRLFARGSLIIGTLKGWVSSAVSPQLAHPIHRMDARENFEYLTHELASWRHSRPLSSFQLLMANRHMSRRPSQFPNIPQERSPIERVAKGRRADQRVTVHYEGGQAPFLQIRFSTLNFPEQAVVAGGSGVQSRRQSSSEIRNGIAQMHSGRSASAEIPAPRNASRSFLRESGHTISDSMSIVRELALRFPLPPRVTGRYRGSILGQRYEGDDDDYPLVGVSREPSTRRDNAQPREESAAAGSAVLSTSGSIKRKPAPPLLPIPPPAHANEDRPSSSWGGLASKNSVEYTVPYPATPTRTRRSVDFPSTITDDESRGTPQRRPRQLTPRQLYDRASGALSVISIRSAEWLSSAHSQPSSHPQFTPASIEAYYTGGTMISPQRASADPGDVMTSGSGEELLEADQYISIDGAAPSGTPQSRMTAHMSIGQVSTRTTPTPTVAQFPLGREPIASTYGEVQGID
jgi:hypothetical protein